MKGGRREIQTNERARIVVSATGASFHCRLVSRRFSPEITRRTCTMLTTTTKNQDREELSLPSPLLVVKTITALVCILSSR